jgi:hypothetical protein
MEFLHLMAVHAHHPILVVNVGVSSVFTGELGINPAAMTHGARFPLIFPHEFVAPDQADADPTDPWTFHMAVTAGGMTGPAGLLKHLFIKALLFCR